MITKAQLRQQLQKAIKQLDSMEDVTQLHYNVDEDPFTDHEGSQNIQIDFEEWDEGLTVFNMSVW